MVNPNDLVRAMVDIFGRIAPLMAVLADQNPIIGHIDNHPASLERVRYQMQPGSVAIAWIESRMREAETTSREHVIEIYLRALKGDSSLDAAVLLMNGVPTGGGNCWRFCALAPGVYQTEVTPIARTNDEEHIDYVTLSTQTLEISPEFFPTGG